MKSGLRWVCWCWRFLRGLRG